MSAFPMKKRGSFVGFPSFYIEPDKTLVIGAPFTPLSRARRGGPDPNNPASKQLKQQLRGKLKLARGAKISRRKARSGGDDPECRGADRRRRIVKVGLVERIERIRSHLEPHSLVEFRVFG